MARGNLIFGLVTLFLGVIHLNSAIELRESEQMALELSEVMLPPKKVVRSLEEQLRAVRKFYPEMASITYRPKVVPGEIILAASIDDYLNQGRIDKLNTSRYGPLQSAQRMETPEGPGAYLISFRKPYHPERLVERVQGELGIKDVSPHMVPGDGNDIYHVATAPTYSTFTFKKGWGPGCVTKEAKCENNHYWEFTVAPTEETNTVKLEREYGSDL